MGSHSIVILSDQSEGETEGGQSLIAIQSTPHFPIGLELAWHIMSLFCTLEFLLLTVLHYRHDQPDSGPAVVRLPVMSDIANFRH